MTFDIANDGKLKLPIDFLTERIAFLARTGAGKSGGMRVLFESFLDANQFVIFVDPKGDGWGIRAAGTGAGRPVLVMGGDHGDVPLQATAGKIIAEFLVRERVSTVLDISDFGKADMVRFVTDLAGTLYRKNRDVLHVFLDEADMVAGEKFYDPKCLEAIQLIQNKGRHRGFGVTVATQRSAMINKSVLFASGTLIAMQTTGPRDIKAVREWLDVAGTPEATAEIISALPTLKTREAFVYSPQHLGPEPKRIVFRSFTTFDSMRTPRPGEARQQPKKIAEIDLTAIQRDMAATIEQAKANDPGELKRQIAELKRQLSQAGKGSVTIDTAALDRARAQAAAERDREWKPRFAAQERASQYLAKRLRQIHDLATVNGEGQGASPPLTPAVSPNRSIVSPKPVNVSPKPVNVSPARVSAPREPSGDSGLTKVQQRILDALAWYESLGNSRPTTTQVGAVALIDPTGGYFSNMVGPLSSQGLVERGGGCLALTEAGRAAAQPLEDVGSLDEYHEVLRSRVRKMRSANGKTIAILDVLIAAGGEALSGNQIGERIGVDPSGGYFSNCIGPLSTAGLITRRGGMVEATSVLFPEGLR